MTKQAIRTLIVDKEILPFYTQISVVVLTNIYTAKQRRPCVHY